MLSFTLNGSPVELNAGPLDRLSDVLRGGAALHGVRVSCSEGECGSCTVIVDGKPVTSCLMLAHQVEGKSVTTIEGLSDGERLHAIQEAFIEEQAFQCAFCTSGFILSAKAFLAENPDPTEEEIRVGMSGNICRCGAYPYIVRAVKSAAAKLRALEPAE